MMKTDEQTKSEFEGCYGMPTAFWATIIEAKGRLGGLLEEGYLVHAEPIIELTKWLFERMSSELEDTILNLKLAEKKLEITLEHLEAARLKLKELTAAQIADLDPGNS